MDHLHPVMRQALEPFTSQQSSLASMMGALDLLERFIDDLEVIDQDTIAIHFDAIQAVDQKTDRLIAFMERMKMEAATASEKAEAWSRRSKACENALSRCKEYVKELIHRFPDLEFRGKHGKLALQKNPPSLKTPGVDVKSVSLKAIYAEDISKVPEQYRVLKQVWTLDTDKIKTDLKAGVLLDFAELEQGESIRIKI